MFSKWPPMTFVTKRKGDFLLYFSHFENLALIITWHALYRHSKRNRNKKTKKKHLLSLRFSISKAWRKFPLDSWKEFWRNKDYLWWMDFSISLDFSSNVWLIYEKPWLSSYKKWLGMFVLKMWLNDFETLDPCTPTTPPLQCPNVIRTWCQVCVPYLTPPCNPLL